MDALHEVETILLTNEASGICNDNNNNNNNNSVTIGKKLGEAKAEESEGAETPASSEGASDSKVPLKKPYPLPHRISICIGGVPVLESSDLSTIDPDTCTVNQAESYALCDLDEESWGCKSLPNMVEIKEDKAPIVKSQFGFLEVPSLLHTPSEERETARPANSE